MAEHDDTIARAVQTLKEPVRIDPSLTSRVMSEIEALPMPDGTAGRATVLEWLRRPRTIRLSPLGGLAMAAGLTAVVLAGSWFAGPRGTPAPVQGIATAQFTQPIQFVLVAPEAGSVTLVGDFNDWNLTATPMEKEAGDGVWWVTVPLEPGRYRYSFVVDGTTWLGDPNAPTLEDEFGRSNAVVTIGGA